MAGIILDAEEKRELTEKACQGDKVALQRLLLAEYDRLAVRIRRKVGSAGNIGNIIETRLPSEPVSFSRRTLTGQPTRIGWSPMRTS